MRERLHEGSLVALAIAAAAATGCEPAERTPYSYYEERIAPVLDVGCQRQTTGCHVDDGNGFALGNLDLTTYDTLMKRSDVLAPYGPYSVGLLLLKAGDPISVRVRTVDPPDPAQPERRYVTVTTDIRHGGGEGAIAQGSPDYSLLKQWIDGGHSRTGVPDTDLVRNLGNCVSAPGSIAELPVDLDADPEDGDSFRRFVSDVQPVLVERCAGSRCHGSRNGDLQLSCGEDARQQRWNYAVAIRHVSEQAVQSELLRRPLAMSAGGVYHEGGDVFADTDDNGYEALRGWAEDLAGRRPDLLRFTPGGGEAGLRFFANRVQPVLVRKGCMFLGCHSPAMFHDLRLRGGARGEFSEIATRRNHEMSRLLLALESADPNSSRLIAKNLCPEESGGRGVKHRGGALLEDFGGCGRAETRAALARCEGLDVETGDLNELPAYCVLARWHAIEREQALPHAQPGQGADVRAVAWVARPAGTGGPTEFHVFRPDADLLIADASGDAEGRLTLGTPRSLLASCGLPASVDVRGPAVSWDGERIAFAARAVEDAPLRLYEVTADGASCAPIAGIAPADDAQEGILLHDFDPAYAPDGRLVFASTRGYLGAGVDYSGPTRTPAALEPNANLYVFDAGADPRVRQLTYLLDHELSPSFMADGRVIFTAQKRAEDFHQLAGRRLNLDGGDYHPLFAQRPSVGFESATEIVELANRNLAFVAAPLSARDGGGAIAVVNRSIGPDQDDRDPGDRAYIHSLTTPAAGAFGGGSGVFRSPAPLPSGRLIASCDLGASDLDASGVHYGLCELDPTGAEAPRELHADPTRVAVEAVAVHPRAARSVFESRGDEVNGTTRIDGGGGDAVVHYLDAPLLATLLFTNTREGRPLDDRIDGLSWLEPRPPPNSAGSFAELDEVVEDRYGPFYQSLRPVGGARLRSDGSLRVRLPGGVPLTVALTGSDGELLQFAADAPFSGPMRQREAMQFYPGERANQSMQREMFDGLCGGCHGSVSGRELDIGVDVDVLTSASSTSASDEVVDLR
jgi:hypothetical protein